MIELLIVVAIIGVLAAVGIPMYNGYIIKAKITATKENHLRVTNFYAITFTKCATGSQYVTLKDHNSSTGSSNRLCSASASKWVLYIGTHFNYEVGNWGNPYHPPPAQCCQITNQRRPSQGSTYMWAFGNRVRITTNIGKGSGIGRANDELIVNWVTKE